MRDGGALKGQLPVGDGDGHLEAVEFVSVPLYVAPAPLPVGPARLAAWPTPFNALVKLVLEGADDGPVAVEIHDARGRTVRRLSGLATAGRAELVWDGRDGNGRTVASGTYFARAGGARPAATRLTLVK